MDDIDGCEEGCENTMGSFFCTCPTSGSGFRANGTRCVGMYSISLILVMIMNLCVHISDIDECSEGVHNCSIEHNRKCNNTIGEFECVCDDGYEENSSGMCIGE